MSAKLGQPSTKTYNVLSWVLAETDFDGIVTARVYDRAGRATDPASRTVHYAYDGFGRIVTEAHFAAGGAELKRTTTSYDTLSRPKEVTQSPAGVTTIYDYATPASKVSSATITHTGITTRINYDEHGREETRSVNGASVNLTSPVSTRDAEGRRTAWTVGSRSASATYDAAGKLKTQSAPGISATYTYDVNTGRKTGDTVTAAGVLSASTYTYTGAGRLSGALTGTTQRTYAFDARGNLKTATTAGATATFTVDANDRLTTSVAAGVTTTYTHDSLGRRTSQTLSGVTASYTYDNASRLTGWQRGADRATYTYDGAGQRTRAVVTQASLTTTTTYNYDGITLLSLVAQQGTATWTVTYLYDEDARPYAGVYTAGTASPVTFLVSTNDRGDVVALTTMAGTWFARYAYDPYGRVLSQATQAASSSVTSMVAAQIATRQPLRYAGYTYDAHSATYYLSQRHYDPATMRFRASSMTRRAIASRRSARWRAGPPRSPTSLSTTSRAG